MHADTDTQKHTPTHMTPPHYTLNTLTLHPRTTLLDYTPTLHPHTTPSHYALHITQYLLQNLAQIVESWLYLLILNDIIKDTRGGGCR